MSATRYLDTHDIGNALDVAAATVSKWLTRYADSSTPCPEPDVVVGHVLGWSPHRLTDWRAWLLTRPGRGAGGGRPPLARARTELAAAEHDLVVERPELVGDRRRLRHVLPRAARPYGVDADTALHLWTQVAEAGHDLSNQEADAVTLARIIQARDR